MRNGYFEYIEGNIYYELHGEGNKKTIVFIHGFSLDSRIWEPQIKEFQNTHQVLVYDMRGYRKSSLPKRVYSHHEDLKALLDFLHIQNTTLIGHSLGGEVAIDFALTYPSYVNRLVLISTSISGYFGNVNWDVSAQRHGIENA